MYQHIKSFSLSVRSVFSQVFSSFGAICGREMAESTSRILNVRLNSFLLLLFFVSSRGRPLDRLCFCALIGLYLSFVFFSLLNIDSESQHNTERSKSNYWIKAFNWNAKKSKCARARAHTHNVWLIVKYLLNSDIKRLSALSLSLVSHSPNRTHTLQTRDIKKRWR